MAKAKAARKFKPATEDQIEKFQKEILKECGLKAIAGPDIRDADLKSVSTGSAKLDWALGTPFVEGSINEFYGENGTGKAQPLDAKVLTPNGFIPMGEVEVGTKVCTPNGNIAKVLKVFPQGRKEIYNVVFSDGTKTQSCDDHLWLTKTCEDRWNNRDGSVKPLKDIRDTLLYKKQGITNHTIPTTKPVKFNGYAEPINPYILGVLIGDGTLYSKGSIRLSSGDEFILSQFNKLPNIILNFVKGSNCDYRVVDTRKTNNNWIKDELDKLGLLGKKSHNKFIPDIYKHHSQHYREEILRGLLDSDGYIDNKNGIEFSTVSELLRDDVMFLVRSLGGRTSFTERMGSYNKDGEKIETQTNYRVRIAFDNGINPFKLPRKADKYKTTKTSIDRFIVDIQYAGEKECQCILLDDEDHLYITDDFIVTHNTTFALEVAANATLMGKPVYFFDLERKLREAQINMIPRLNRELFMRIRPDNGEEAVNMVEKCVREVPGCVVIFDSITQMLPEVEQAENAEKMTMGLVARLCAKMVRKIAGPVEQNRCMVLFISHITSNLNPYASGDTTKGGKAVPDISSQRVRLKKLNSKLLKHKKTGDIIGQMVTCRVMKNNMARPYREVEVPIVYGRGIDRSLDLLQIARDLGVIDYENGWYIRVTPEFPDGKNTRESEMIEIINGDQEYRDKIYNEVVSLLG